MLPRTIARQRASIAQPRLSVTHSAPAAYRRLATASRCAPLKVPSLAYRTAGRSATECRIVTQATCLPKHLSTAPRRAYSNASEDKKDDDKKVDDDAGGKQAASGPRRPFPFSPDEVTPYIKFTHRPYQPIRPKLFQRIRKWWYSRSLLRSMKVSEEDIVEGAKAAFRYIIPFTPQYGAPLPPLDELRKRMEVGLLHEFWRIDKLKNSKLTDQEKMIQLDLVDIVEAEVIDVFLRQQRPKNKPKEEIDRNTLPVMLGVTVRFHTKEEVKKVAGVEQLSPSRIFDMDHIWIFCRKLPSPRELKELKEEGEQIPDSPWRLFGVMTDYRRALMPLSKNALLTDKDDE